MQFPVIKVAQGVSGDTTTEAITLPRHVDRDELSLQVDITADASVAVQAKVDPDLDWITISTITVSTIQPIAKLQQLRLAITGNTGKVSASLLT